MRTITASLEQQVVAAIMADRAPPLDQLLTLCSALEAAITAADDAAEVASTKFLDPIETPDANVGRAEIERTKYVAGRLRTLLPLLQDKCREVEAAAIKAVWEADFARLAEQRNQLATELKESYVKAVGQLVNLFARVAALDRQLGALHQSRPDGVKGYLKSVEVVARNLDQFDRDNPSIFRDLRLVDWHKSTKLAWPIIGPSAGLAIAMAAQPDFDPRYSADWHKAKQAETAARRIQEQQRLEAEAAATRASKAEYERSLLR